MTAIVSPPICILPRVALSASADTSARAAPRPGERESVVLEWPQTDARKWLESGSKVDSLVRVAWALLLRSYTSLDHICFELATSTRRQFELYDCHITGTTTLKDLLHEKERGEREECSCEGSESLCRDDGGNHHEVCNTMIAVEVDGEMQDQLRESASVCTFFQRLLIQ